jgi:hypothetical protein
LSDAELVTVQESEDLANVHAEGNEGARK